MRPDLDRCGNPVRDDANAIRQRLRDLPAELPPPTDWAGFRRRGRERAWQKHTVASSAVKWQHAVAAAALTALIAAMAVLGRSERPESRAVDARQEAAARAQVSRLAAGQAAPAQRAAARARAAQRWLDRQPAEPAIVRVGPRLAVASLEDRIAFVDDVLTDERLEGVGLARLATLQQERARLVSSLAQVRYAEKLATQAP